MVIWRISAREKLQCNNVITQGFVTITTILFTLVNCYTIWKKSITCEHPYLVAKLYWLSSNGIVYTNDDQSKGPLTDQWLGFRGKFHTSETFHSVFDKEVLSLSSWFQRGFDDQRHEGRTLYTEILTFQIRAFTPIICFICSFPANTCWSSRRLEDMSWRRLEDVFKTSSA